MVKWDFLYPDKCTWMLKCFPKNIHSNGILLMSRYLNNVTAIYLTGFAEFLYIFVAFTYLYICLFLSRAARMFISLFWAGLFVCASAHSGELSCWEIQMSHSVFRFSVPYLFPMRKPWIKDLCPIGPKPPPPFFCILVVFALKPKEGNLFYWMKY